MGTPYFSWQRSHAVHHSKVNHIYEGESHVPKKTGEGYSHYMRVLKEKAGTLVHGVWSSFVVMVGFVLYLLFGASGGPAYGLTNHFWPKGIFKTKLFPKKWHAKVIASGAAVIGVIGALAYWAKCTSFWTVAAVYGGPYLILNAWLGVVTLLHHTDVDVPHLEGEEWSFIRGAFLTIDRPYYPIVAGFSTTLEAPTCCITSTQESLTTMPRKLQKQLLRSGLTSTCMIQPQCTRLFGGSSQTASA